MVFVAEKDWLVEGARLELGTEEERSVGKVEIVENECEKHVFHLLNPASHNALVLMEKIVSFFKQC